MTCSPKRCIEASDPLVPEVAEAHLAEHVVHAGVAQRRHLLRDAVAAVPQSAPVSSD